MWKTYLLTTLAAIGIVLNTVAMAATCRERHMRRASRTLHAVFFAAENLFLAGRIPRRPAGPSRFLPATSGSCSCARTSGGCIATRNTISRSELKRVKSGCVQSAQPQLLQPQLTCSCTCRMMGWLTQLNSTQQRTTDAGV